MVQGGVSPWAGRPWIVGLETLLPILIHTASALSAPSGHLPLEGKAGDTREACYPQTFGHRPIYVCGEAATTTLNPEP